jgi:alpha-galactosidase
MLDPHTAATLTLDQIDALCDDLTSAHGEVLPAALRLSANRPELEELVTTGRNDT